MELLAGLDPASHTEQTLLLLSTITKVFWSVGISEGRANRSGHRLLPQGKRHWKDVQKLVGVAFSSYLVLTKPGIQIVLYTMWRAPVYSFQKK